MNDNTPDMTAITGPVTDQMVQMLFSLKAVMAQYEDIPDFQGDSMKFAHLLNASRPVVAPDIKDLS